MLENLYICWIIDQNYKLSLPSPYAAHCATGGGYLGGPILAIFFLQKFKTHKIMAIQHSGDRIFDLLHGFRVGHIVFFCHFDPYLAI